MAGVDAVILGKPDAAFFAAAVAGLPTPVAIVGDDAVTDVAAGMACGLRGGLVRTGKFQPADLEGFAPEGFAPDAVLDSAADLLS